MPRRVNCQLCKKSFGCKQIYVHYAVCIAEKYTQEYSGHYVVSFLSRGMCNNQYYIYAIINPKTTFATIDNYLRNKWLNCCGHLSNFECEKKQISKRATFKTYADKDIIYEYDMGSTTTIYMQKSILIKSDKEPLKTTYLHNVLQNDPFKFNCKICDKPASYHDGVYQFVCETHKDKADNYLLTQIVNSPRMGERCFDGDYLRDITFKQNYVALQDRFSSLNVDSDDSWETYENSDSSETGEITDIL